MVRSELVSLNTAASSCPTADCLDATIPAAAATATTAADIAAATAAAATTTTAAATASSAAHPAITRTAFHFTR